MEDLSIALVCLFCVFFVFAPLAGVFTARRRVFNVSEPGPKQLHRARRKLSTVTACSTGDPAVACDHDGGDVEASAAQLEVGECPICIGPLIPEPALIARRRESVRQALDELTTRAAGRSVGRWRRGGGGNDDDDQGDDDVLTLNSCGHSFHSRCLASWFLMERLDCPVCRVVYYHRKSLPSRAGMTVPRVHMGSGRAIGLGYM